MGDKEEKLWQWVDSVLHYEPISWDRLPELDLYMDQVITLMSKELDPFSLEGERLLTPSMINNYVKDGVLPRPNQKKYGREHLSRLLMICTLKSVLSLPEIDSTLRGLIEVQPIRDLYQDFADAQNIALKEVAERVEGLSDQGEETMYQRAIGLALEANARRIAAARILDSLAPDSPPESKEPRKSRKEKGDAS
mgnify:FL=1